MHFQDSRLLANSETLSEDLGEGTGGSSTRPIPLNLGMYNGEFMCQLDWDIQIPLKSIISDVCVGMFLG